MSRETKDEEKARLMREILEKRKNSQTTDQEPITLTTGSGQKTEPESSSSALASMLNSAADTTNDMLRYADDAFAQLRKVLKAEWTFCKTRLYQQGHGTDAERHAGRISSEQ